MNNRFVKYMFCLVMFCTGQPFWVAGQSKLLTLEECISYAKANNLVFKIQALKNKQAEANSSKQITRFLPQVNANLNHQYDFGSAIDPNTNNRVSANFQFDNLNLNAQVNLFNFAELWESKLQQKDVDIENANTKVIEQEYTLTLIEKFYISLATQEWAKVLKDQIKNTELQVDRIHQEVQGGLKPESDIFDIQVVYTQEKKQLKLLEQQQINQISELLQWINRPIENHENFILVKNNTTYLDSHQLDIDKNAHVLLEKQRINKIELEYTQLLHNFLPKVTVGYSLGTFYSQQINGLGATSFDFGSQFRNNKSQYLGLGVQIPIFSRGDNFKGRQVKKIQLVEQNLQVEKVKTEQKNRFNNYYRILSQYKELTPLLLEASNYAHQSLVTTQFKYEYGKVDISSYKGAKNQTILSAYDIVNNNISISMLQEILKELQN
jgi:outer membrane protein